MYKLFLPFFILLFLPSFLYADDFWEISSISDLSTYSYISAFWSQQKYPQPDGSIVQQIITPQQTIRFRTLDAFACSAVSSGNSVEARLELRKWYVDTGMTLLSYSDWVILDGYTSGNDCALSFRDGENLHSFDFNTYNILSPDAIYGIALVERYPELTGTNLVIGSISYNFLPISGLDDTIFYNFPATLDYYNDRSRDPWGVGEYKSSNGTSSVWLFDSSQFSTGDTELYISVDLVRGHDVSTTTVYTDCDHDSNYSSYYSYCPLVDKDFNSITFNGSYGVSNYEDYYIRFEMLDSSSRPLDDLSFTSYFYPDEDYGTYDITFPVPDYITDVSTSSEGVFRACLIPLLDDADTYDVACTAVYFVECSDEDSCNSSFYAYTQSGDGVTLTFTPSDDGGDLLVSTFTKMKEYSEFVLRFVFPFSIVFQVKDAYDDYEAFYASSTDPLHSTTTAFSVPLDMSSFGLPATDTVLPISAMISEADILSPDTFDLIDRILWGLFALFVAVRVVTGTFRHGMEFGSDSAKGVMLDARQGLREGRYSINMFKR